MNMEASGGRASTLTQSESKDTSVKSQLEDQVDIQTDKLQPLQSTVGDDSTLFKKYQRNFSQDTCDDLTIAKSSSGGDQLSNVDITQILSSRYSQNLPYTYIGNVIIAVNPYKKLKEVYNSETKHLYHSHHPYELGPHLYSQAEDAFRTMKETGKPQAILISGESGAGKTESCKLVLEYLAAVSISGKKTEEVKHAILQSNPLLEAFGNAKTLKNDNSSRFGKYLDCFFNFEGQLQGGSITTLLLEKHRVVNQRKGERNFHIFYQICSDEMIRSKLKLGPPKSYRYLNQSGVLEIEGVNDGNELKKTQKAMEQSGMSTLEQVEIFRIVAGILHLGNLEFKPLEGQKFQDACEIVNGDVLKSVADIFKIEPEVLKRALLYRSILVGRARGSVNMVTQNVAQASFNRDALAKAIYQRLFNWIVKRINTSITRPEDARLSIGILDIYGFESYSDQKDGTNSFEQFCINFVNEKIQQRVQHSILNEQNEYSDEGVPVKPVKYFDCDESVNLIEGKPHGVFAYLDEESMMPKGNDTNFLHKMTDTFTDPKKRNKCFSIPRLTSDTFAIKHYAAQVAYNVVGWVEKNRDTLFANLISTMQTSQSELMQQLFPVSEKLDSKRKLQNTMCSHFKNDVFSLIAKVSGKKQHFIRCIIPNHEKKPDQFAGDVVHDQVKYLGLAENVIVRKTGYSINMPFEQFLDRYKYVSRDVWPNPLAKCGSTQEAIQTILRDMRIPKNKYFIGKTKIFLTSAEELFDLDECVEMKRDDMARIVQKAYRKYRAKKALTEYAKLASALRGSSVIGNERKQTQRSRRGTQDQQQKEEKEEEKEERHEIIFKEEGYVIDQSGKYTNMMFIVTSHEIFFLEPKSLNRMNKIPFSSLKKLFASPLSDGCVCITCNEDMEDQLIEVENKADFIERLKNAYDKLYENSPLPVEYGTELEWRPIKGVKSTLKFRQNKFFKQTTILPEDNGLVIGIEQKVDIFQGLKVRRRDTHLRKYNGDYIRLQNSQLMKQLKTDYGDSQVLFSAVLHKYNKSYKQQDRILLVTDLAVYNLDPNGYIVNRRTPIKQLKSCFLSTLTDDFFLVKVDNENDYLLESSKKTEAIQCLADQYRKLTKQMLKVNIKDNFQIQLSKKSEKKREIIFLEDPESKVTKLHPLKNGNAEVRVRKERASKKKVDVVKDVYNNLKLRRKESLLFSYKGDYLFLQENPKFQKIAAKSDDKNVLFSVAIEKINKRFNVQRRKFVIMDKHIYNLDADGVKLNSQIKITDVSSVSVSPFRDGFFCLHIPNDYDYFAQTLKKTELIKSLSDQYKKLTGKELQIIVDNKFPSTFSKQKGIKTIEFQEDPEVRVPTIYPSNNGIIIKVNNMDDVEEEPETVEDENYDGEQVKMRQGYSEQLVGEIKKNFKGIKDGDESVYGGKKGRNRMSIMKEYIGDYERLEGTKTVKQLFKKFGDNKLLFTGKVNKVNNKYKMQERLLIVTDKAVYNLELGNMNIKRRIPLDEIQGVSVSPFPDGVFVFHCPKSYDYIYDSDKKTEIIQAISNAKEQGGKELGVNVEEQFDYSPKANQLGSVMFVMDDNADMTWIEPTSKGLLVHVKNVQPAVVLEAAYVHVASQTKPIEVKKDPILIKLKKKDNYKLEIRFYVNENLGNTVFHEKIDTVTKRMEYESKFPPLQARDERYVVTLPERSVIYSLLSKTRVKAKLEDEDGKLLLAVRFVYDIK